MIKSDEFGFASPPCFAPEGTRGENPHVTDDPGLAIDVTRWRKAERERLIAARLAISVDERQACGDEVAAELDRVIEPGSGLVVSVYWPFRGELDLRDWMGRAVAGGLVVALPVVVGKGRPLVFREWRPGCRMERGIWNIPVPVEGDELVPDVTIAPFVGYDPECYRLGYGGGFYDRTIASFSSCPRLIGVGHPVAAIRTIHPQPHDIPMDMIITGAGRLQQRTDRS